MDSHALIANRGLDVQRFIILITTEHLNLRDV